MSLASPPATGLLLSDGVNSPALRSVVEGVRRLSLGAAKYTLPNFDFFTESSNGGVAGNPAGCVARDSPAAGGLAPLSGNLLLSAPTNYGFAGVAFWSPGSGDF